MEKKRVFRMAITALLFTLVAIPMVVMAGDAKNGEKLVKGGPVANCVACHSFPNIEFPSDIAPDLVEIMKGYTEKDRDTVRQWVYDARKFNPDTFMPPYGNSKLLIFKGEEKLSAEEQKKLIDKRVDDIVEFLYSLKKK
ncbi:MAG: c-type cytochrome [Nitrospiraceae bacterium]|nr:c-type cytochrome [Nitrospiraceae bacterium]